MLFIKKSVERNFYVNRKKLEDEVETLLTSNILRKATTFSKIGVNVIINFDAYMFCEKICAVWDRIEQDLCEKHAIYMR
jgi:hypothetical protein